MVAHRTTSSGFKTGQLKFDPLHTKTAGTRAELQLTVSSLSEDKSPRLKVTAPAAAPHDQTASPEQNNESLCLRLIHRMKQEREQPLLTSRYARRSEADKKTTGTFSGRNGTFDLRLPQSPTQDSN